MTTASSGTSTFSLDVDDLIEHALLPLGGEHQSGIQAEQARRTLNLLLIKLQNKNIPLFKIDFIDVPITIDPNDSTRGLATYDFEQDIVDVLKVNILDPTSNTSIPMERYGLEEYHRIPNKLTSNRPTVFATERLRGNERIHLWPVPPASPAYILKLLCNRKIEDVTASYQQVDISYRYYPLLVAWLSYDLACNKPNMDMNKLNVLKSNLDTVMPDTFDEDRERADYTVIPGGISGR